MQITSNTILVPGGGRGAATSLASQANHGGVAFWAHVGGFVAGLGLIKLFPTRPRRYRYF